MKLTDCKKLSLKNVKISGDVIGKFGTFEIEQTFVNNTKKVLEVGYTFPIAETATVVGFEVHIGDKVLKGQCKETSKAKKEYTKNIVKGNSAYLMEEKSDNIFAITIGKLAKNEEVKIKINYIDKFEIIDNQVQVFIPTLVPPKYNSEITDKLNYDKVDYTVDFHINILKNVNCTGIQSPTHKFKVNITDKGQEVEVFNYDMSRDFKLYFDLANELTSTALTSKTKDGKNVLYMSFMPEITDSYEDSEKEYLFLVDVSGSMYGEKLEETKNAVIECLKQLDNGDKFNIIPFESGFESMSINSLEYNEKNLEKAIFYIKSLKDKGGTEILEPIKFALYEEDTDKVILLFTDGEVGNEDEIITFVENNIGKSRLFPFGIDYNVNSYFLRDLAKVGNGKAELIMPHERIDDKIIRTFARIQTPLLEELKIDYGRNKLIDEIREDNALFNYEFYNVFAKTENLDGDITLKGRIIDKEYSWQINKDEIIKTDVDLEVIFAKMEIDRLEDYIRNSKDYKKSQTYKDLIIELSEKYNINSKYTSFLTIYERENKVLEAPTYQETTLSRGFLAEIKSKFPRISFDGSFDDECFDDYDEDCMCCLGEPDWLTEKRLYCRPRTSPYHKLNPEQIDFVRNNFDFVSNSYMFEREPNNIKYLKLRYIENLSLEDVSKKMRMSTEKLEKLEDRIYLEISYLKDNMPKIKLLDKIYEYFENFVSSPDKSIVTYILFALYSLHNKRYEFKVNDFLNFLTINKQEVLCDDEIQELLYLICTKILTEDLVEGDELAMAFDNIVEFLNPKAKKVLLSTNLKIGVTRKGIEKSDIPEILEKDLVAEKINEILWYYCK